MKEVVGPLNVCEDGCGGDADDKKIKGGHMAEQDYAQNAKNPPFSTFLP